MLNEQKLNHDTNLNTSYHADDLKVNTSQLSSHSTNRPDDVKVDTYSQAIPKSNFDSDLVKRDSLDASPFTNNPNPSFGENNGGGSSWGGFDTNPETQKGSFGQYDGELAKSTGNQEFGGFGGYSSYGGEQSFKKPKQDYGNKTEYEVFISKLSFDATDDDVRQHFSKCGNITQVKLLSRDGKPSGRGFIKFGDEESMNIALNLNDSEMMGRHINVEIPANKRTNQAPNSNPSNGFGGSNNKTSNAQESSSVIVRNLSYKLQEDEFGQLFEDCGSIKKFRIIKNEEGQSKGFGFVDFDSSADARNAIAKSGTLVHGRNITVEFSVPKEGKQSGGDRGFGGGARGRGRGDYGDRPQRDFNGGSDWNNNGF